MPTNIFHSSMIAVLVLCAGISARGAEVQPAGSGDADLSYELQSNDVVRLTVFEEADLSTSTKILQTGEAVFPLIGAVMIEGLSIRAATNKISDLYAADYLVAPRVSLTVDQYGVRYISVLGSVGSPGQIPFPATGKFDIASAIATAGGLAANADPNRISLVRTDGSTAEYALSQIEKGSKVYLGEGDRVIVNESRFLDKSVIFVGEVRSRGPVAFPMDGKLDLVVAIARAGGFSELANPKKVSVNRRGKVAVIDVKEMSSNGGEVYMLEPGDIITVPERLF